MAAKMASVIGIGAVAMALSSCSDDNFDIDSPTGGIVPDGMTELTLSMNFSADEAELRSRSVDFDAKYVTIDSVWVGVYDIETGNRVGSSAFYVGQGAATDGPLNSQNAKVSIVYYDAHPEVRIVAVANYSGVKSATESFGTLESELVAAKTWSAFKKVSFQAPDADAPQNNDRPLLMGFYFNKGANVDPNITRVNQYSKDEKANLSGAPGVSVDTHTKVKLVDGGNTYDSQFGKMKELTGNISLRRLGMNANVTVKGGSGVKINKVSYQVVNMPQSGYIAPRRPFKYENYPGGIVDNYDDWKISSPNKADSIMIIGNDGKIIDVNGAYTDGDLTELEEGVYSFSFQHLENLHWALKPDISEYKERGKACSDDETGTLITDVTGRNVLAALCPDGKDFNNMASAIILTVDVVAPNAKGTVTYYIPEGYCNDEYGVASRDNAADFTSVRNTNYNYTITINGLNDLAVDVKTGNFVHDDITGTKFGVSPMDNNTFTLMDDVASNIGYRLYQKDTDGKVIADYYNFNPAEEPFALLADFWEPFSQESNGDPVTVSLKAEDGTPATLDEFVKNAKRGSYTVEFEKWESNQGDPSVAYCRLYIFEISQLQKGNGNVVYSQTSPDDTRPPLVVPSFTPYLTRTKFVDQYLTLSIPPISGALADYKYEIRIDNDGNGNYISFDRSEEISKDSDRNVEMNLLLANIKNDAKVEVRAVPTDNTNCVASAWTPIGTTKITAPKWTQGNAEWDAAYSYFGTDGLQGVNKTFEYLTFNAGDNKTIKFSPDKNLVLNNSGSTCSVGFKVYRGCKVVVEASSTGSDTRPLVISLDGKELERKDVSSKTSIEFTIDSSKVEDEVFVQIYSGQNSMYIYSITLQ